jgi:hypothetical protein
MIDRDDTTDDPLETGLRKHLARELDPQRGRALAAFEGQLRRERLRRRGWIIGVATSGLIAASIAIAVFLHVPRPLISPKGPIARNDDPMRNIQQVMEWEASDEGVTVLDRSIPVRKVRQNAVEQVEWFDPKRNASMKLTVPVERVLYVQEETY